MGKMKVGQDGKFQMSFHGKYQKYGRTYINFSQVVIGYSLMVNKESLFLNSINQESLIL